MTQRAASTDRTAEAGRDIASFVLRFTQDVYTDEAGESRVRWRGHVRHVQSDAEARFTEFADAVAFMQQRLARLTMDAVADRSPADQRQAMADSLQLWERMTSGYATAMLDAFSRTLAQSEAVRQQVGEQLGRSLTWWAPFVAPAPGGSGAARSTEPDAGALLAALGELARRLEAIEDRAARIEAALQSRSEP